MKVTLKNVKISEFASEETVCFEATVYIDGERSGVASNEGRGGCNRYHPRELGERLEAYAKTLPDETVDLGDGKTTTLPASADMVISNLITREQYRRDLQKVLKNRVLFRKADGKLYETKRVTAEKLAGYLKDPKLKEKLEATVVLNLLPFDEALANYAPETA